MSAHILVSDSFAPEGLAILEAADGIELSYAPSLSVEELRTRMIEVDGMAIRSGTTVDADLIAASGGRLKAVARAGVGTDNVDKAAASEADVVVMNTPHGNNITTAEHAIGLIFAASRNIVQASRAMADGRWDKSQFGGRQLHGRVAGVVGFGNIGRLVVDRLVALGMTVLVADPFAGADQVAERGAEHVALEDLFRRADVISIHVPYLEATHHLVNGETLALMKPDAFLVCAARGGIVDEEALVAALDAGQLAGAALDVFAEEPPAADHPVRRHPKVICTPHLGASTKEAQLQVSLDAAQQLVDFFQKGEVRNQVNA
ncbi:MAG: hypothetical protein CMH50_14715 [Myxococcales bacterium]|nr:hypothetical protein [Myxococcales bacterium]